MWQRDWNEVARAAMVASYKEKLAGQSQHSKVLADELAALKAERAALAMERIAMEDERKAYQEKRYMLVEQVQAERLARKELEQSSLGRDQAAIEQAHKERDEARQLAAKDIEEMEERLKRLLSEQRGSFEAQLRNLDQLLAAERKKFEEERKKFRAAKPIVERPPSADDTKKAERKRGSILGNIDIDESRPFIEQLRMAIDKNAAKIIDLFREWDADGDGMVSKKEFRKAMPMIGFDVPKAEIDQVFDSMDSDVSGAIGYKEMQKLLKIGAGKPTGKPAAKAPAATAS